MSQSTVNSSGTRSVWSDPIRLSGMDGADGDGIEYIYYLSSSATAPVSAPTGAIGGWTDNPVAVTRTNPYLYVSYRTSSNGI